MREIAERSKKIPFRAKRATKSSCDTTGRARNHASRIRLPTMFRWPCFGHSLCKKRTLDVRKSALYALCDYHTNCFPAFQGKRQSGAGLSVQTKQSQNENESMKTTLLNLAAIFAVVTTARSQTPTATGKSAPSSPPGFAAPQPSIPSPALAATPKPLNSDTAAYLKKNADELTKLHDAGDAKASFALAVKIIASANLQKKAVEALPFLQRAADAGDKEAMLFIASIYLNGADGIPKDAIRGTLQMQKAGALDFENTLKMLAAVRTAKAPKRADVKTERPNITNAYAPDVYEVKDMDELTKLHDAGDLKASRELAFRCLYGYVIAEDGALAVALLRRGVEAGDAKSTTLFGYCYLSGKGVARDAAKAVEVFNLAADLGDAKALTFLGTCYSYGLGVERDENKGMQYFLEAKKKGDSAGALELGRRFIFEQGEEKGASAALLFLEQAAEAGNIDAMREIAGIYLDGADGIPKNEIRAHDLMKKAAFLNDPDTQKLMFEASKRTGKRRPRRAIFTELNGMHAATAQEGQAKAIEKIPEIGIKDTVENILFRGIYAQMKEKESQALDRKLPSPFSNPNWPLEVARDIAFLGDDIRGQLVGGTMTGAQIFYYVHNLDASQLKAVLGSGENEVRDGSWTYSYAAFDSVTKRRDILWLNMTKGRATGYKTGWSSKSWNNRQ